MNFRKSKKISRKPLRPLLRARAAAGTRDRFFTTKHRIIGEGDSTLFNN